MNGELDFFGIFFTRRAFRSALLHWSLNTPRDSSELVLFQVTPRLASQL